MEKKRGIFKPKTHGKNGKTDPETFMGISREKHPNSPIWKIINADKDVQALKNNIVHTGGGLPEENDEIFKTYIEYAQKPALLNKHPELENLVKQEMHDHYWKPNNIGDVKDQKLANLVFDFSGNSGDGPKKINKTFETEGEHISPETINQLNETSLDDPMGLGKRQSILEVRREHLGEQNNSEYNAWWEKRCNFFQEGIDRDKKMFQKINEFKKISTKSTDLIMKINDIVIT